VLHLLTALGGAALPLVAGYGLGRRLTRTIVVPETVRFAVGTAALSVIIFALLLARHGHWWVFVSLGIAGTALTWSSWRNVRIARPPWWIAAVALIYAALYLIYAATPEVQPDALHYHLSIAVEAARTGGFPQRVSFYDVLPQGMELLFAMAYSVGGEVAAKLVHLTFLALTIPLLIALAGFLQLPAWMGWCAGLFYAITPVAGVSSLSAYNDAAVAFFGLATCHLLALWWHKQDPALLVSLGLCAGFCYAIKFTGGLFAPLVLGAILYRKAAPWRTMAAMLVVASPWMIRAAVMTGNPFAPMFNRFFPNPYFHISSEQALSRYLRDYGGVQWLSLPWEVTLRGDVVQGLLGPMWLLAPLALLALRRPEGRALIGAASVAGAGWLLNIGTRFLMPALPFLALALCMVLPRTVMALLLAAHAVLSWPQVIPLWAKPNAWALDRVIPITAEVRDEQQKMSYERALARLVESNTRPGDRIFDMANAPAAITRRDLLNAWQTAAGDRLVRCLHAAVPSREPLVEWRSVFTPSIMGAVRVRYASGQAESAGIREIALSHGQRLMPNVLWSLAAWPNPWDAPLVLDRNRVSGWATWEPVKEGMYVEIELPPSTISEIRITADSRLPLELYGKNGDWQRLPLPSVPFARPPLNLRQPAIRLLRREGLTHVLAVEGTDGLGAIGKNMVQNSADWDLRKVAGVGDVSLFEIISK